MKFIWTSGFVKPGFERQKQNTVVGPSLSMDCCPIQYFATSPTSFIPWALSLIV